MTPSPRKRAAGVSPEPPAALPSLPSFPGTAEGDRFLPDQTLAGSTPATVVPSPGTAVAGPDVRRPAAPREGCSQAAGTNPVAAAMSENELEQAMLFDLAPDPEAMKRCNACGEVKPASMFRERKDGKSSHRRPDCNPCHRIEANARRRRLDPEQRRAEWMWQLYRLPWADYQEMLSAQLGRCAICAQPFSTNPRLIHVDHDHACDRADKGSKCCRGCVRGILCARCNVFVGWIETGGERIGQILRYLGPSGALIWCQVIRDVGYELISTGEDLRMATGARDG